MKDELIGDRIVHRIAVGIVDDALSEIHQSKAHVTPTSPTPQMPS